MINRKFVFLILTTITALSTSTTTVAISVKQCDAEAATALEKSYCAILKKGHGKSLPGFFSFRRNPNPMQRLMLKSAASRAGVELPSKEARPNSFSESLRPEIASEHKSTQKHAQPPQQQNTIGRRQNNSELNVSKLQTPKRNHSHKISDNCYIAKEQIYCGSHRYFLAINIPIQHLNKNALGIGNRLLFRAKSQKETLLQYLSHLYPEYIQKMLYIGLGDSTVSFTKFHAIYESSFAQNENFAQRFEEMYELLKKERKTMATRQRYRDNYPEGINNCMQLTGTLITCDNVEQNWVYKKVKSF